VRSWLGIGNPLVDGDNSRTSLSFAGNERGASDGKRRQLGPGCASKFGDFNDPPGWNGG
jgi:hypothetical protein